MSGIHFYNTKKKYFITTNFKVMYSNLNRQKDLKKVRNRSIFLNILLHKLGIGKDHYLLVRPVEKRLESFYKNKFVRGAKSLTELPVSEWQRSLRIFFPYLGINENESAQHIQKQIEQVSFNDMVAVLPQVIDSDGHIRPQHFAKKLYYLRQYFDIPFQAILNIERPSDYQFLSDPLGLDTNIRSNSSKNTKVSLEWTESSKQTVQQLYKEDYILLKK